MPTAAPPPYPDQLGTPTAGWVFDYAMPAVWMVAAVWILVHAVRVRTLPMVGVLFFAATTMFWQEWFADWGPKLVYNRELVLFESWTSTWFQTYWKPVGVVFGYGLFFALAGITLLKIVPMALDRFPHVRRSVVVTVTAVAMFYVFDVAAESLMTALGWYTYTDPVPPSYTLHGSMSLVFPALPFLLFAGGLGLLLFSRDDRGLTVHERAVGVGSLRAGVPRELARLAAWAVVLNLLLLLSQPLTNTAVRLLFLGPSPYVP